MCALPCQAQLTGHAARSNSSSSSSSTPARLMVERHAPRGCLLMRAPWARILVLIGLASLRLETSGVAGAAAAAAAAGAKKGLSTTARAASSATAATASKAATSSASAAATDVNPTGPFTKDDLLVSLPTYGAHEILIPLSRVWRQGVRMHVTTDPTSDLHRWGRMGWLVGRR